MWAARLQTPMEIEKRMRGLSFFLYNSNTVCYCWIDFEIFQACFPPIHSDGFKNVVRNAYEASIFLEFLPIIVVCFFLFESL